MDLWKELPVGDSIPDSMNVVIEVPKGSRNRYRLAKLGKDTCIRVESVISSTASYPVEYGIIPQTYWEDGDPLDVMVLVTEPSYPGCVMEARPIALLKVSYGGHRDDKILAVPVNDARFAQIKGLESLPEHTPKEIAHFFTISTALEEKKVEVLGWGDSDDAKKALMHGVKLFKDKFGGRTE